MVGKGYKVFAHEIAVAAWADAAYEEGCKVLQGDGERRHGNTWFVGVDALQNAPDGSINGVPLAGTWLQHVPPPQSWHAAQLSVIFNGYPKQDTHESDAAHRFRRNRDAAHVDGLLPEGPDKRRFLREPHCFIVGLPLNDARASPLVVWEGSHHVIRAAFHMAFIDTDPATWADIDITEVYQKARKQVFDRCKRVAIDAAPGQAILLNRHLVHGVAPWGQSPDAKRMIAYFRPQCSYYDWLNAQTF